MNFRRQKKKQICFKQQQKYPDKWQESTECSELKMEGRGLNTEGCGWGQLATGESHFGDEERKWEEGGGSQHTGKVIPKTSQLDVILRVAEEVPNL